MKGKFNKITSVALISLLALAGCGGSKTDEDVIQVTFWHTFGKTIQDNLQKHIDNFEQLVLENEGVKVEITQVYKGGYDDILSNILQGFSAANVPTIAVAYPDHVADYLNMASDYVVNFDDYMYDSEVGFGAEKWLGDKYGIDDFVSAYIEEGQQFVQEGTYVVPLMKSTEVMFYNEDLVEPLLSEIESLDASSPYYMERTRVTTQLTTQQYLSSISWDELMTIGGYASAKDDDDNYIWTSHPSQDIYPVYYDSDGNLFITKMFQNEIPYSSVDTQTGVGSIDFETGDARTAAEAMVQELKDVADKDILVTKGSTGEYGSNYFVDEQAIFSIASSGGTGYQLPTSDTFKVGVCSVPYDNDNPLYVCQGPSLCLLRNPGYSDEVNDQRDLYGWKFIKYLTNTDVNVELCTYGSEGYSPVRNSCYVTDDYLDYLEWGEEYADTAKVVAYDIGDNYFTSAVFPGSATLRDQVGGIITEVLLDHASISDAFDTAINQAKLDMQGGNS
ncbi:MAG: hypothetical protein LUD22_03865 [Coprobacillus sp.]|nr:hypothetical protein [Coprobacillus sp.]